MKKSSTTLRDTPAVATFRRAVLRGMRQQPKTLPTQYLYDARGSRLFDRICQLPEYYLTRTELEIMQAHGAEMAAYMGPRLMLIELGSGSSIKTRILLDHLVEPVAYIPVDISRSHLQSAAESIASSYPHIPVRPVCADFTSEFTLPAVEGAARRGVYLPGSTIGNFTEPEARMLLARMAHLCGQRGCVLIGIDLQKEVQTIVDAYNDAQGVTAEFNLNLLNRINRELDADFDLDQFEHTASYCHQHNRIEMLLVSQSDQRVTIGGEEIEISASEPIRTEYSHKYTIDGFARLAGDAQLTLERTWTDNERKFAVMYLTR